MTITSAITGSNQDKMEIRSQVELRGEPFKTFKFKTESMQVNHQATIIEQKNIGGDILIYGNAAFGIWDSYKWGTSASQSFILGLSLLGVNSLGDVSSVFETIRVVAPDNIFDEPFLSDYFINTSETTATFAVGGVTF
jgi:hypothetical protein